MKNNFLFVVVALFVLMISCGPAAEDRQEMHRRAKIFQDSIANFIRTSMDEAAAPGPNAVQQIQPAPLSATAQPQAITPNVGVNQTPGQGSANNTK